MLKFTTHTKKKKQDLLKPINLFLEVTNTSNKTIEIANVIHDITIFENCKEVDGRTSYYDDDYMDYVTLKPNESITIEFKNRYYISFQYLYKNRNSIEKFDVFLEVAFFVKGLANNHTEPIKQSNKLELEVDFTSVSLLYTPDNKRARYIEYKDNIVYISEYSRAYEKPSKKIKINKDKLKVLSRDYIIDNERVYRDGRLQKISPNGFKIFNKLFAGNSQKILTSYGDAKVKDPETFEVFNVYRGVGDYKKGYCRDKYHLYFFDEGTSATHATVAKACREPSTFKELYTKDENSEIYGMCERTVYINGVSISMADAKTWQDLGMYSKDKKSVYYFTYKVKGADPKTFEAIKDPEAGVYCSLTNRYEYNTLEESRWGRDKNHYYNCGKQSTKEEYLKVKEQYKKSTKKEALRV